MRSIKDLIPFLALWVFEVVEADDLSECNIQVQYLHLQDSSGSYKGKETTIMPELTNAVKNITTTFPGSSFGIWQFQDKQKGNLICGKREVELTTDLDKITAAINEFSSYEYPGFDGGSTADELLWYLPTAPEVGWKDTPGVQTVKIIGLATDDATFSDNDGMSNNAKTGFDTEDEAYPGSYDPQNTGQCHDCGYPELGKTRAEIINNDIYVAVYSPGNTISEAFYIGGQPTTVEDWFLMHFTDQLNIPDRSRIVVLTPNSGGLAEAIYSVVLDVGCNITTTTPGPTTATTLTTAPTTVITTAAATTATAAATTTTAAATTATTATTTKATTTSPATTVCNITVVPTAAPTTTAGVGTTTTTTTTGGGNGVVIGVCCAAAGATLVAAYFMLYGMAEPDIIEAGFEGATSERVTEKQQEARVQIGEADFA